MASKKLNTRMWGYEFSSIEYDLLYSRKDAGFVRPVGAGGRLFYLDPSPFFESDKNHIYFCETPPLGGTLVQTNVEEIRKEITGRSGKEQWLYINIVQGWHLLDISEVGLHRLTIQPDEMLSFFTLPYIGEKEEVEQIAQCSILFAVSSPPSGLLNGGIHTAVLGKKNAWSGFEQTMKAIPPDLTRLESDYLYTTAVTERPMTGRNREENVAFLNPEQTAMHVPLPIGDFDIHPKKHYVDDFETLRPMVTASILEAVLRTPVIPATVDTHIIEYSYKILDECKAAAIIPYKQDFADLVPKLTRSIARFERLKEASNETVERASELWMDLFTRSSKFRSTPHSVAQIFKRLDDNSRKLYIELCDQFGVDIPISRQEIQPLRDLFRHEGEFDEALERLNNKGLLIFPRFETLRVLDFQ